MDSIRRYLTEKNMTACNAKNTCSDIMYDRECSSLYCNNIFLFVDCSIQR